jgi:hypothetical protein
MHVRKLGLLAMLTLSAFAVSLSAQTVLNISAQGTAETRDVQISNGGGIEFQNNAAFSVAITFTKSGGTEFGNIASIGAGDLSSFQTGSTDNTTVNYSITNLSNGQIRGPYSIEVGTGPIQINISGGWPDLDTISLPTGEEIQFNADAAYTLSCDTGSFSPNLTSLVEGLNTVQTLETEFSSCTIGTDADVPGNGKVHIGG